MGSERKRIIVCAVDESDYSKLAWDWSVENIFRDTDEVHLVHVYNKPRFPYHQYLYQNYKKMLQLSLEHDKKMQEISNKLMWRMIQKAQENGDILSSEMG
mmetsp:Transcript_20566/g.39783  ORF Transcript_20566/g.39783 Transcript_20566/m.39783 type:complete len:100 (-) Transcript_20566:545-844(-)